MNQQEFQQAAAGSLIGNRIATDIEEIVRKACTRLGVPARHIPKGDALDYIVHQMRRRHTYTLEELYLAIDLYNTKSLDFTIQEFQPFALHTLNGLMNAYKNEKARVLNTGEYVSQQQQQQATDDDNARARQEILTTIYTDIKTKGVHETIVMYCWMIAFRELEARGRVTQQQLHDAKDRASQLMAADLQVSIPTKREDWAIHNTRLKRRIKLNQTLENYQAMIVVDRYMRDQIALQSRNKE